MTCELLVTKHPENHIQYARQAQSERRVCNLRAAVKTHMENTRRRVSYSSKSFVAPSNVPLDKICTYLRHKSSNVAAWAIVFEIVCEIEKKNSCLRTFPPFSLRLPHQHHHAGGKSCRVFNHSPWTSISRYVIHADMIRRARNNYMQSDTIPGRTLFTEPCLRVIFLQ